MVTSPDVGVRRPAIRLNSVDLPQPLGPRIDRNDPRRTPKLTSRMAATLPAPFWNVRVTACTLR